MKKEEIMKNVSTTFSKVSVKLVLFVARENCIMD